MFLCGLIPAAVAFVVRMFVQRARALEAGRREPARIRASRELFTPEHRRATLSGFAMAVIALITWWSVNAFIPIVSTGLARATATAHGLDRAATLALGERLEGDSRPTRSTSAA